MTESLFVHSRPAGIPSDGIPTLRGHLIGTDRCGDGEILAWCPNCRTYHQHSWSGEAEQEHKAASCSKGGYYIALDPASRSLDDVLEDIDDDNPIDWDNLWSAVHDVDFLEGEIDDPQRLAQLYLNEHRNTVFWGHDFYEWKRPAYGILGIEEIKSRLAAIIHREFVEYARKKAFSRTHFFSILEHCLSQCPDYSNQSQEPQEKKDWWLQPIQGMQPTFDINPKDVKKITKTLVENILECLRAMCFQGNEDEPFWIGVDAPFSPLLVAKNCILWRDDDGRILTIPPTPRLFTRNALDYDYDPNATCPLWLDFVDQILGAASDRAQALQEIMGYVLTDDTRFQKIFLFIGLRRSGKGTVSRVMKGLIGERNCCGPTLGSLQGQFGLQPLYGKTLAIVGDARLSGRADAGTIVERLLSISGEDSQSVDIKYRSPVDAQLKTRFLLISNEIPRLNDASATLPSRCILIPFERSFFGREDLNLTEKLLRERSGILNWAITGLDRLRARGKFLQPEQSKEILQDMEELASPVLAFLRECCDIDSGEESVADVFSVWKIWCGLTGRKPSTVQNFGRDLKAAANVKVTRPRSDGKQFRAYEPLRLNNRGVQLKTDAEEKARKTEKQAKDQNGSA